MYISKKYSKRGGHFLKLEFNDEKEYERFIGTLKCAIQCLKRADRGDETDVESEEQIVSNLERLKVVGDDLAVSSVIFQDDMFNLFSCLFKMSQLITTMDEYIKVLKDLVAAKESLNSMIQEQLSSVYTMLNMHKFMIHMIHDEGFVLDEEGKEMWCTPLPEKDEEIIIFDNYFKFSQQTPPSDDFSSIISEDED